MSDVFMVVGSGASFCIEVMCIFGAMYCSLLVSVLCEFLLDCVALMEIIPSRSNESGLLGTSKGWVWGS